jgi:aminoglycoside phosphotransferase family enzyme
MNEIPPEQREVARFLATLARRSPQLTHISAVFVGQNTAWQMKNVVRLDFLDFSTLALRKHFLIREWELNRRTAPTLYRDVVPIWRAAAGDLRIGAAPAEAPIVEWVLRMAAVPAEDFLDRMAASGVITPALLLALADAIAAFHLALPPVLGWDSAGALARVIEGNFLAARHAGLCRGGQSRRRVSCAPARDRSTRQC